MSDLSLLYSFLLSIFVTLFIQRLFLNNNIFDKINIRSSHISIATRSGGISIFITVFIISLYFYLIGFEIYDFSILVPLSLLTIVGLYDDLNNIDFKLKFIFQIIAAKIIIDNGLIIDNLHGVIGIYELNRVLAQSLTILIIVAIVNSINFIDGLDGLAISIVMLFIILFEFFTVNSSANINFSKLIIAATIPLYYFNFRKNKKVFLGDAGSLFLGGVVSIYVIQILTNGYIIKDAYDINKIIFVMSILIYPFTDLLRIFIIRVYKGVSPFKPDKNHIHHKLLKIFKNHKLVTVFIVVITLLVITVCQLIFN